MNQINLDRFQELLYYYQLILTLVAIVGVVGFSLLPSRHRRDRSIILSLAILVIVPMYEIMATILASTKSPNNWVYNIFSLHLTAVLFMLLIRNFLKRESHRKLVILLIVVFLFSSLTLHLAGFVHYNDSGEFISFLNTILVLTSCALYFYELITLDEFLDINPLREFSFWACTAILFYFSSSFMVYISFQYLIDNQLDVFYMVIEIPRNMAILTNLLLCAAIISPLLKERLQLEIIHV